jgi:NADH dehydrogenase
MNQQKNKPTVIVGGGFTGLFTALHFKHRNYSRPTVLIDQKERFTFQPLLYEYFSREMNTDQVCPRYVDLLEGNGITFVHGHVEEIDLMKRQIKLESDKGYAYEYLVLAVGSVVNYFGIDGAEENSWPFRTQDDAFELSTHIRDCLQQASRMDDPVGQRKLLTFALMGGGPSGVELAGTLGDLLPKWYADMGGDPKEIRLILFEQLPDLLRGDINKPVRDTARKALRQRTVPVDMKLEHRVTANEAAKPQSQDAQTEPGHQIKGLILRRG